LFNCLKFFFDNSEKRQSQANTERGNTAAMTIMAVVMIDGKAAAVLPVPPCWLQILCMISSYRHCVNEIFAHVVVTDVSVTNLRRVTSHKSKHF
jgi:hypothetical protein